MKVLGISMGRKNERSDIYCKQALMGAEAAGADVQFINTVTMNIGQCRGCGAAQFPHGTETLALHAGETALLFCGEGSATLRAGTETLTLAAHESALIEDAPAQLTVEGSAKLMLAQMYR